MKFEYEGWIFPFCPIWFNEPNTVYPKYGFIGDFLFWASLKIQDLRILVGSQDEGFAMKVRPLKSPVFIKMER